MGILRVYTRGRGLFPKESQRAAKWLQSQGFFFNKSHREKLWTAWKCLNFFSADTLHWSKTFPPGPKSFICFFLRLAPGARDEAEKVWWYSLHWLHCNKMLHDFQGLARWLSCWVLSEHLSLVPSTHTGYLQALVMSAPGNDDLFWPSQAHTHTHTQDQGPIIWLHGIALIQY